MKIVIASDHAAYDMRVAIIKHLVGRRYKVLDMGADKGVTASDYPDYAIPLAHNVASGEYKLGILVCGTGIGMSIAANKVKGIRAALCADAFSAKATREHNDANVLCLGARVIDIAKALELVDIFVSTPFSNEDRHTRRIEKIMNNDK